MKKKRYPGARVKHRMKENWIKMYDKHGYVLRVETVINNPREFKFRRHGKHQGEIVLGWFPMAKGILPQGYTKCRRFGGLSNHHSQRYLAECRRLLSVPTTVDDDLKQSPESVTDDNHFAATPRSKDHRCTHCGGRMELREDSHRTTWPVIFTGGAVIDDCAIGQDRLAWSTPSVSCKDAA